MKRFFQILFILTTVILMYLSFEYYQNKNAEDELKACIENILLKYNTQSIIVETHNRGKSPLLTGTANKFNKNKILNNINKSCQVNEVQDFIDKPKVSTNNLAFINFSIDAFNNIITIKGAFNNQKEFDDVMKSFNDAQPNMRIQHDVRIDSKVNSADFALDMTLLLPSIDSIHVANISIKDGQLILQGIIRDQATEQKTLQVLHQLFDDDLTIVNQLQRVADNKIEINEFKFETPTMPKLNPPQQKN